jgi:1-phosphatidylinositol-4-phosphate 5-kinase
VAHIAAEKLSEGASGAFMFFSANGRFIVKTLSKTEAAALHARVGAYSAYLAAAPDSLLTRYFGSHSVQLYGTTFNFVVMQNVFRDARPINARCARPEGMV